MPNARTQRFFSYAFFHKLSFAYDERYEQGSSLWGWTEGVWRTAMELFQTTFSLLDCLCIFVRSQLAISVCIYLWILILFHQSVCLFCHYCLIYCTLNEVLKSENVSSLFLFFFKVVLAVLGLLHFHVNYRINLSISTKRKEKKSLLKFWPGFN